MHVTATSVAAAGQMAPQAAAIWPRMLELTLDRCSNLVMIAHWEVFPAPPFFLELCWNFFSFHADFYI